MSQPRLIRSFSVALALTALAPLSAQAQSNAPLTGNMSGGAAAGAAQPAPLPAAALPNRPVVQQVQTSMPQTDASAAAQAAAPAAPVAAPPAAAEVREGFGDVTRGLLAAQADGRRAGGALPILGPVSSAAWTRYVDSFRQPIPEWFQKRVETKNTN
ncbi:DUF3613 domain-containing protein [Achromobacter sp. UMC46]|uniref:DUF3613 domain-containing protein n=1 Tax=Achromobacter sp. UMC46 TaxID=1862319 RepID=UPI00160242A4|nr:DUF3613 domain-containing protein [Achromobacter sp. UMC46]MBB1593742.1 TapA domain-containing protein [Achromobacter sp. UMC46]